MTSTTGIYSQLNPATLFMMQRRQRVFRKILGRRGMDCSNDSLLEIGCGHGQWLVELQTLGFVPERLAGIELDERRAVNAKAKLPSSDIRQGDASKLPWQDNSFDFVFQSTMFTSVLDDDIRSTIASEMMRVCKPGGSILWYDFKFDNPKNPDVKGVGRREIQRLFRPWECSFTSVTLAPPLARLIVPISWTFAELAETFIPFFKTHIIAELRNPSR